MMKHVREESSLGRIIQDSLPTPVGLLARRPASPLGCTDLHNTDLHNVLPSSGSDSRLVDCQADAGRRQLTRSQSERFLKPVQRERLTEVKQMEKECKMPTAFLLSPQRSFPKPRFPRFQSMLAVLLLAVWLNTGMHCPVVAAGEFNQTLNLNDPAPAWTKLPGVDGQQHSLADIKAEIVVVAFTCNSCPYAVDYEGRLSKLAREAAQTPEKLAVVAINVNLIEEDSLANMQARARELQFPFTYLFDESQQIARKFGASRTPEFFVLNAKRQVVYMGAFDDNTNPAQVTKQYVHTAIAAAQQGKQPEIGETVPVGCAIRYARQRRSAQPR